MTAQAPWAWKVWPFDRSDRALDKVAMKLGRDSTFDAGRTTIVLEPAADGAPRDIPLEVLLDPDVQAIEADCGIGRDRVYLSVVVSDVLARVTWEEKRWPLDRVPRIWKLTLRDCSGGPVRVKIVATLRGSQPRGLSSRSVAFRDGSVLAQKVFSLSIPLSRSLFPVENTSFRDQGWDPNALWFVEWRDLDGAHLVSPEDAVVVHINKDLPALQELWRPAATRSNSLQRTTANMVRELVAAEILTELCCAAFGSFCRARASDATLTAEPESLTGRLLEVMQRRTGIVKDAPLLWAKDSPGQISISIQGLMKSGASFDLDALNALRGQE